MRLGTRRRMLVALALVCLLGWPTAAWWLFACLKLFGHYFRHRVRCDYGWLDFGNGGCGGAGSYNAGFGSLEVFGYLALAVGGGWLLARWALAPVRSMTDLVGQLGPTSLGLRLTDEHGNDETGRLADAINRMLDRVAEGYESQRRFAANASHELRTPLATQRALIEISLADALTPDQLRLLSRQLLATNERNEALIEGLLALAETDRGLMAHVPIRLDEVVHDVVERLRPAAEKADVHLEVSASGVTVIGEQQLVDRLVTNLLQNATKYNHPGGSIQVRVGPPGRLIVSNTGPVVPADAVPSLFEPFRRLSGERLEHGGGAGLGLTIVRSIVAAHGGAVQARANPDGGLTVTVDLVDSGLP